MKKSLFVMAVMLVACVAYASTLSVPWFIDNADAAAPGHSFPPAEKTSTWIYLHNNTADELVCGIEYFTWDGNTLAGHMEDHNTFAIPALSTIAFRPIRHDPDNLSDPALLVPRRPAAAGGEFVFGTPGDPPNGSAKISWVGGPNDVQGLVIMSDGGERAGSRYVSQWGTLLPPGIGSEE